MSDSGGFWSEETDALLKQYRETFHDAYFHFGESYPSSDEDLNADIRHWLDIGNPRPWADYPEDAWV